MQTVKATKIYPTEPKILLGVLMLLCFFFMLLGGIFFIIFLPLFLLILIYLIKQEKNREKNVDISFKKGGYNILPENLSYQYDKSKAFIRVRYVDQIGWRLPWPVLLWFLRDPLQATLFLETPDNTYRIDKVEQDVGRQWQITPKFKENFTLVSKFMEINYKGDPSLIREFPLFPKLKDPFHR